MSEISKCDFNHPQAHFICSKDAAFEDIIMFSHFGQIYPEKAWERTNVSSGDGAGQHQWRQVFVIGMKLPWAAASWRCDLNTQTSVKLQNKLKIVAAFRWMHVSPTKHSYAWPPRKCDYKDRQTDRQTHWQTGRRRTKWSIYAVMLRSPPNKEGLGEKHSGRDEGIQILVSIICTIRD